MGSPSRSAPSEIFRRHWARGRTEGKVEGKVEGDATALLAVLAARGIHVPDEARARITGCTDLDQLNTWVHRAATAKSIDDLFG